MHIKSNIEHNVIDVVVLAICPIMLVLNDASSALYYIAATALCFFVSAIFCLMFNKYLSKTMKVFITAVLSTFLITIFNYLISNYDFLNLKSSDNNYYAVLSTIVMSIDIYYIDTKAAVNHYLFRLLNSILVFAVVSLVFVCIKEFLSIGTLFGWKPFEYSGFQFFKTITFDFILLAFVCVVSEVIYRAVVNKLEERSMAYAKLLKQVRNEKKFQYDTLRRQKLLTSDVEYKFVDDEQLEVIEQKENETKSLADLDTSQKDKEQEKPKVTIKRKRSKLRVSKEAKVQRVFDREAKGGKK